MPGAPLSSGGKTNKTWSSPQPSAKAFINHHMDEFRQNRKADLGWVDRERTKVMGNFLE